MLVTGVSSLQMRMKRAVIVEFNNDEMPAMDDGTFCGGRTTRDVETDRLKLTLVTLSRKTAQHVRV